MKLLTFYLSSALAIASTIACAKTISVPAEGGRFYEVAIQATLSEVDTTNRNPVAICIFRFSSSGVPVRADDALVTDMLPSDRYGAYEYLFADRARFTDQTHGTWVLQARVPALANTMSLEIRPWQNSAPVELTDPTIRGCEPTYDFLGEDRCLHYAFRTDETDNELVLSGTVVEEGSNKPVVGLSLHFGATFWGMGLDSMSQFAFHEVTTDKRGYFQLSVSLPSGCMGGTVELTAPSQQSRVCLFSPGVGTRFAEIALPSQQNPILFTFPVSGADRMTLFGMFQGNKTTSPTSQDALITTTFFDQTGSLVNDDNTLHSERSNGQYYFTISTNQTPFRLEITVPETAAQVEFQISRFNYTQAASLQSLSIRRQIPQYSNPFLAAMKGKSSSDDILARKDLIKESLDNWLGKDIADALRTRSSHPDIVPANAGIVLSGGWTPGPNPEILSFPNFPNVPVSPDMNWKNSPVQSSSWKLKFYSCAWIPFITANLSSDIRYERCKALWRSFFQSCSYPDLREVAYSDHICAIRVEAILLTMYGTKTASVPLPSLQDNLVQDPDFFCELLYQLSVDVGIITDFLRRRSFDLHNHNLIMAKSLLAFADCFADYEFAKPYRSLAVSIIQEHLHAMFEPDGVIREQSTEYHLSFYAYFSKMYAYLSQLQLTDENQLREMRDLVVKMLDAERRLCPPDGRTIPMGDTSVTNIKGLSDDIVAQTESITGFDEAFHHPVENEPSAFAYPNSGLYIFRNPSAGNYLIIDISPVLKVHGHRDLGSWQYYAKGEQWTSDLGGPYRYRTPEYRRFIASESHTLIEPVGREQTAGVAYGVDFQKTDEGYVLEFRTNVYGPEITHSKRFEIKKDISSFRVIESFDGNMNDQLIGRVILANGVSAECDGNDVRLLRNGKHVIIHLSPECENVHVEQREASYTINTMTPVETIVFSGKRPLTTLSMVINEEP